LSSRRCRVALSSCSFFFQAEDGIRDRNVTGVQTCALPIFGFLNLFLTLSLFLCGVLRLSALLFANALPVLFLRGRFDLKPRLCRSEERRVGKECTARVGAERSRRKSRRTRLRERSTKGRQS